LSWSVVGPRSRGRALVRAGLKMVWILVNLVSLLPGAGPQLCGRRAALLGAAAFAAGGSRNARADTAVPTFTLKGIPGIAAITGSDAPRPGELGVIAKGADGSKSGRLQFCDKKGCITSFGLPEDEGYIPPWTYAPEELRTTSVNDARRAALRAQLAAEGGDSVSRPARKTLETAQGEMRTMLASVDGCLIVKDEPRYFLLEFEDPISGAKDDVEFLFSLNSPVVGYRSAPRTGADDKRQRERIRDLRKRLEPKGWKSVGRAAGVNS